LLRVYNNLPELMFIRLGLLTPGFAE